MTTRASELIDILSQVDFIKQTKLLSPSQKERVYTTLLSSLPAELLCGPVINTRNVVKDVLIKEIEDNVKKESTTQKGTSKAKETSAKGTKEKLLRNDAGHTGGKSVKKRVVNKTKNCLLYTSYAAADLLFVDLGRRRIII